MAKCPNFASEEQRALFNSLVERLGGKPIRPEHVQDLRSYFGDLTQKELAASDAAYELWDKHETPQEAHAFLDSMERVEEGAKTSDTERARAAVTRNDGYHINDSAMRAVGATDFPQTPITEVTAAERDRMDQLFNDAPPPEVKAAATAADYFYRWWRWFADLRVVSDANPHIEPLQRYDVTWEHLKRYAAAIMLKAEDTAKMAYKLADSSKAKLYDLIDDYMNERFLSEEEREKGIHRKPNQQEFADMVKKTGVDERGLAVFRRMVGDFQDFAKRVTQVLRDQAEHIQDPKKKAEALAAIDAKEKDLLSKPYFPAMRFGTYTILIEGPEGRKFFRAETKKARDKMAKALSKSLKPGERMELSKLPLSPSVAPFAGLPPAMLDLIKERLTLSDEQKRDIEQLKFEVSPLQSFAHRFQHKTLVPGYSRDFLRAYANYFYHGARYLANIKFMPQLEEAVQHLWDETRGHPDRTKRAEIAQFVQDHLKLMKDTKADWMRTRAFAFHMILGFRPASAMTNLTQTVLSTYPALAAEFGDAHAARVMLRNTTSFQNFYKHTNIMEMPEPKMRALSELVRLGVIRGALADQLAGLSEGRNLELGFGSTKGAAAVNSYLKMSGMLFELAEQANRRIAGMSTYDLAVENPDAKWVKDSVARDPQLYAELTGRGFEHRQAAAIIASARMVDRTQFQFSREYRPAYQRGIGSLTMVFRLFQHRMLWNMYNYPAAGVRTMLVFAALGGMAGIPGEPDINALVKLGAWWMGKDFDLEDEARKFAVDVLGMKGKNIWDDPFTITNGIAAHGYGIPALLDMFGEWAGVGKFAPELNRSQAVAMSNILPIDPYAAFGPSASQNPYRSFANGVARGTGAMGSYAFNVYKAMANIKQDPDEFRRWERVAPVALGSIGHSIRLFKEGGETTAQGAMLQRYDPHNPKDMAEMIAVGLGYTPLKTSKQWTRVMAEQEAVTYWNVRREMLLNQYWTAVRSKDPQEKQRMTQAIRKFNAEVRGTEARGKAITAETIQRSMQTRATALQKREAGQPLSTADSPLIKSVRKMFPGVEVDQRRVR